MVPSSLRAVFTRSPAYTWSRSSGTVVLLRNQRQGPGGPVGLRDVSPERAARQAEQMGGIGLLAVPGEPTADRRPVLVCRAEPRGGVERGALVEPVAVALDRPQRRGPPVRLIAADPPPVLQDERV